MSPSITIPIWFGNCSAKYGLEIVSIDADWPIWSHNCIEVLNKTIVWADMLGCHTIITTDSDKYPEGRTDDGVVRHHPLSLSPVCCRSAKRHKVKIALEPHGYLTTKPDALLRLVTQNNSDMIGINFDTGNSFIAGQDPVAFLDRVKEHVIHMHVKDVSGAAGRGDARRRDGHCLERGRAGRRHQRRKYLEMPGYHDRHRARGRRFAQKPAAIF